MLKSLQINVIFLNLSDFLTLKFKVLKCVLNQSLGIRKKMCSNEGSAKTWKYPQENEKIHLYFSMVKMI